MGGRQAMGRDKEGGGAMRRDEIWGEGPWGGERRNDHTGAGG